MLAGVKPVAEVKMFGGIGFMLNGNLLVGASKRGLLVRVGKDRQSQALAKPGTRQMEMRGRLMDGYTPSARCRECLRLPSTRPAPIASNCEG